MGIFNQLKHAWNAFSSDENQRFKSWDTGFMANYGASYGGIRPDRNKSTLANGRSIVTTIYNQIAIDVAAVDIHHVKVDREANDRYLGTMTSGLQDCLSFKANIDEGARAFKQNIAMTLFEKGVIAIVPVDTDIDPSISSSYEIRTMRIGEIVAWFPEQVRVLLYNEKKGCKEEVTLSKADVAIVENPLYSVMNDPNSTLQRLIRKLSLLDSMDEQSASGKLDLIIQLPYVIKSEARKQQAEQRRKDIELQLQGSKYGIAYTDGTERITQLNRPAENNMLKHVESLTAQLYTQFGLTAEVFSGTADEKTMNNYYNRTVEPILTAIAEAMAMAFITKTGRTQGQTIKFFRDPFKLLTISDVAEVSDKLIRNEVVSSNEFRSVLGMRPSKDPKSDQLRNPNMPSQDTGAATDTAPAPVDTAEQDAMVNNVFDSLEASIDKIIADVGV